MVLTARWPGGRVLRLYLRSCLVVTCCASRCMHACGMQAVPAACIQDCELHVVHVGRMLAWWAHAVLNCMLAW